jgi:hypothetical protein
MNSVKYILLISLWLFYSISFADNLNVTISKNHLNFAETDSIICSFYLNKAAQTTIKFVNVFGGEEIFVEENKERNRGWHDLMIHSDTLKSINPSSGVYYMEISGNYNGQEFYFSSFQKPWGESIDLTSAKYNAQTQTVFYDLPKFSMTRVRIGLDDGILFRTLQNWKPINKGEYQIFWDGYDQSGEYYTQISNPRLTLEGFGLPKTVFYLDNPENPENKTLAIYLPEKYDQYCLSEMATKAWTNPGDISFDVEVEGKTENLEIKVKIPTTDKNQDELAQIYSETNELYISLNNNFLTETQDAEMSGEFSIAVPELPKGDHIIMFNYIFKNGAFAIGVKEFTAE